MAARAGIALVMAVPSSGTADVGGLLGWKQPRRPVMSVDRLGSGHSYRCGSARSSDYLSRMGEYSATPSYVMRREGIAFRETPEEPWNQNLGHSRMLTAFQGDRSVEAAVTARSFGPSPPTMRIKAASPALLESCDHDQSVGPVPCR